MVGKTLKSKINGNLFYVDDLNTEQNGMQYYIIKDVVAEGKFPVLKGWFEKGIMQNLEIVEDK